MDRRTFIKVGAASASGLVVAGGTSLSSVAESLPGRSEPPAAPDMDAYLAHVDAGMETIGRWSPSSAFPGSGGDGEAMDALGRKALRTLYLTAMFADLPQAAQQHSGMQERMRNALPEMDEAATEMSDYLAGRSEEDLERVQRALRNRHHPAMQVYEAIENQASATGISARRRHQLRAMVTQADWRLRNQPPSLVVKETLDKVSRVSETDVPREVREDWIAARAGEELFWQQQLATAPIGAGGPGGDPDSTRRHQRRSVRNGARIMGIGLVVGTISVGATAAGAFPFIFVATVGAVLFVIGLIMILVSLALGDESAPSGR